ncbi:Diaminopimelate decarboxylase (plasmid) [Sinorhizobium sojae CCBAU 05684]|uniref:Diaminopimelate decarboxylase n=1 Tax=Sinorhizobium sojae CCBAU 05684 TaxID=716928 RepID=A0A249PHU8_9HYPH|nr:Y4yA family PLP-dependent enzyme [Sinorhizobium sojae]ASY65513.1 Diaminopimelate decarboxylase [Sinorhizobium sojae CCBAU 05684]
MTLHCQKAGHGLPPVLRSATANLLARHGSLLLGWAARYGSPLNLIWPEALEDNFAALQGALTESGVQHAIYYGAKVNKSPGLMRAALKTGAGIDVSSLYELRDATRLGADGARLVATGPAKTSVFHKELVDSGALISVDSPEELEDLINVLPAKAGPQPILLRLRPSDQSKSRFGMPADAIVQCLARLLGESRLRLEGVHFHLSGYRWENRAAALSEAADLITEARRMGFTPRMIDIGGGLPVQYVDPVSYRNHLAAQTSDDYRTGKVPESFYPYGGTLSASDWLHSFLKAEMHQGRTVADYLTREGLSLAMEPGRALADQTAITVFKISRIKALGPDTHVIFVEGSSFSACETWFASEFLIDPIHVPAARPPLSATPPVRAYVAGHSCLDEDVLSNRWLDFPVAPEVGDLLVFANTGGYQMDLLENEFHRHPMPARLRITEDAEGQPYLVPDTVEEV